MKRYKKSTKKDCFIQDRFIYEFDKKVDNIFVKFLQIFGKVKVHKDFEIPLITMDIPKNMRLTTLMNSNKLDIYYKEKRPKNYIRTFEKKLNEFLK